MYKLSCIHTYIHTYLTTSEIRCGSEGRGIFAELSLCCSIVNGAQLYEQFLHVSRLDQALILLDLALYLPNASVSSVFMVLYILKILLVHSVLHLW